VEIYIVKIIKVGEAAKILGVNIATLRIWEKTDELLPFRKSKKGTRYYDLDQLLRRDTSLHISKKTIGYARVSTREQKEDLLRQKQLLELFCVKHGWTYEILSDIGSGINYNKKGLYNLLDLLLSDEIERLVIVHKDRLLRFGSELIFTICELKNIEVIMINQGNSISFEEELTKDVLEIITVFSARLYGSRSHKTKKLIDTLKGGEDLLAK